ncbi:hypothetical protein SAMN05421505_113198 [Sinosporangium album]|uniref:Uncharacterized protein n=1 Tax=Sinosporangium album TaxID=504805 RepID=A0A1G8B7Y8_9ACTN|nr:hypothetical protein SAMN05421505_113198 [Sinosporangium album]
MVNPDDLLAWLPGGENVSAHTPGCSRPCFSDGKS